MSKRPTVFQQASTQSTPGERRPPPCEFEASTLGRMEEGHPRPASTELERPSPSRRGIVMSAPEATSKEDQVTVPERGPLVSKRPGRVEPRNKPPEIEEAHDLVDL